jgi:Tol biopolymer transport system component
VTPLGRGSLRFVASLALLVAGGATLSAQNYFGQNQVQYDRFKWSELETEHFIIYYYPEEAAATIDAGRMAERSYARLSRLLDHQFREKKPIVLFSSRTDFGQNNVTGDLGEGTGGVTEAARHRMLLNFTGDSKSFEHVLTHELVHAFQYDIFARGKAGNGLQALAQYLPPLWFAEGMAEYLSLGPSTSITNAWMRDAALNGKIPTIEQLNDNPDKYFPYRYGHSLWTYIGQKWGDEAIGQIMNSVPSVGVERAFRRELGISFEDLGREWREDLQTRLLPAVGAMDRPRKFAQPLLTGTKNGGEIFLAPALSGDGKNIAFLANGSFLRGQVFIDLWLGNAETGKRTTRLIKSEVDPDFEELRLLYSQSSFSPDGRQLAVTAQSHGKDVLYLVDVEGSHRKTPLDLGMESITGPTWSPDGKRIIFSGATGGITDLYLVNSDGTGLQRLTNDKFGDLQPQWSPDGKTIAFASDRDSASFANLSFKPWRITLLDLATGTTSVLPAQAGLNINPQWAPDGRSIAYISDRTGTANLFLYDLDTREHYQLTNVAGAISALTEYSPAISWARQADRLAFTYYENAQYTIWTVNNPRGLRKAPYRQPVAETVVLAGAPNDTINRAVSVVALLDSFDLGTARYDEVPSQPLSRAAPARLCDSSKHWIRARRVRTQRVRRNDRGIERHARQQSPRHLGRGQRSRERSARVSRIYEPLEAMAVFDGPVTGAVLLPVVGFALEHEDPGVALENQEITTYVARQAFGVTAYPLNRFTRLEFGAGFNNIDRSRWFVTRKIFNGNSASAYEVDSTHRDPTLNYIDGQIAVVSDNTLFGYTGPIMGRRFRFQVSPVLGAYDWVQYLADYRRYDPILFNYLTVATRLYADVSIGPDEKAFPKYIARPDYVRGYDRNSAFYLSCPVIGANPTNCSAVQLLGSRVAVANIELRFPLVRHVELGFLPMELPPLDGLFFYDAGLAWSRGQKVYASRPPGFDISSERYPLRSYGFGLRLNLFNYAILRWDFSVPLDQVGHRGVWTWSLWPSF